VQSIQSLSAADDDVKGARTRANIQSQSADLATNLLVNVKQT